MSHKPSRTAGILPISTRARRPTRARRRWYESSARRLVAIAAAVGLAASATLVFAQKTPAAPPAPARLAVTRPITGADALAARLNETIRSAEALGAVVAIRVVDPVTGTELFEHNSTRPVIPASNAKLPVTAAALDYFGPDKVFETKLLVAGEDLYLVGCGDPSTGDTLIAKRLGQSPTWILDRWADELLEKGKREFTGSVHYIDNALELPNPAGWGQLHPTWGDSAIEWYGAPISGLNYNDNCLDISVTVPADAPPVATQPAASSPPATGPTTLPTSRPRVATRYHIYPEILATGTVTNRSYLGEKNTIDIVRADDRNEYTIKGTLAKGSASDSKPVTDPGAFFSDVLKAQLAHRGITIAGPATRASAAPADAISLTPAGSVMRDVIWRTNKNSQNLFAEGLAKMLGRAVAHDRYPAANEPGSWANAEVGVRAFLKKHNIDDSVYVFADGSGLSRDNRVTTKLISDLLVVMAKHHAFNTFRDSLPIGGVDGTIKSRFTNEKNRVLAKTGTIRGVRSLSGYVLIGEEGTKTLVFSIILNDIPAKLGADGAAQIQDECVRALMEWSAK